MQLNNLVLSPFWWSSSFRFPVWNEAAALHLLPCRSVHRLLMGKRCGVSHGKQISHWLAINRQNKKIFKIHSGSTRERRRTNSWVTFDRQILIETFVKPSRVSSSLCFQKVFCSSWNLSNLSWIVMSQKRPSN